MKLPIYLITLSLLLILLSHSQFSYGQDWQTMFDSSLELSSQRKYKEAAKALETVMKSSKEAYEKNPKDTTYGISLGYLGLYYELSSAFKKAEESYKKSLKIEAKTLGKKHQEYLNSITNLGLLYITLNRFEEAEEMLIQGVEIAKETLGENSYNYSISLNNLAEVYTNMKDFNKAELLYKQAIEIKEKLGGKNSIGYATSINNLSILYSKLGAYTKAESLLKKSLKITGDVLGKAHPQYGNRQSNLALIYKRLGRFQEAELLYTKSLKNMEKTLDPIGYARTLTNLAILYIYTPDHYLRSKDLLIEAKELIGSKIGRNNIVYANTITFLALLHKNMELYQKSEELYITALEIKKGLSTVDSLNYGNSLRFLGNLYLKTKHYKKADSVYQISNKIVEDHLDENTLGFVYHLSYKCRFYLETNELEKAIPIFKKLFINILNQVNINFPSMSEKEKEEFWKVVNSTFEMFNSLVIKAKQEGQEGHLTSQMLDNQLIIKSLLINNTSKIKQVILQSSDSSLVQLYNQLTTKRNYLSRVYSLSKKERTRKNIDIHLIEVELNELEREISIKSDFYSLNDRINNITWNEIQKELKPNEAAIEMIRFRGWENDEFTDSIYYAALIITNKTITQPEIVLFNNGHELEKEYFGNYQNAIKQLITDKESYGRYWQSIQNKLSGIKKVYFSAEGIYHSINLNTLFNTETSKFLIDEMDIQYVTSIKSVIQSPENVYKTDTKPLAKLFGNPSYKINNNQYESFNSQNEKLALTRSASRFQSNLSTNVYEALPETETEINAIKEVLSNNDWKTEIYLESDALEENIKNVDAPQILHIATHGFFDNSSLEDKEDKINENVFSMFNSGLILAGVSNYYSSEERPLVDDGLLTAYECSTLNLINTDLVVLSACETGLGKLNVGEGIYGLQRGFRIAGAKSLLMSLWKVDDIATRKLMVIFYEEWFTHGDKLKAFRKAQQEIKKKYPHPYFWGGFIMVGENTTLDIDSKNDIVYNVLALIFISIASIFLLKNLFYRH